MPAPSKFRTPVYHTCDVRGGTTMKTKTTRRVSRATCRFYGALLAACVSTASVPAHAQTYPSKTCRCIVPLAPGVPIDILARTMAQKMTEGFMQTVIVDNRTGAGGTIGTDIAAKSPPDGYTILLIAVATYTINAN